MHTFEITLRRLYEGSYPLIVEESQGDAQLPIRVEGALKLDQAQLAALETDSEDYGRTLSEALFRDEIRDAFVEALARTEARLRVLLFIEEQSLRGLR